tara:strand:+ start:711824 stop:712597 length:774 start_codon:yes stop_codon:yes gene_type:complete
MVKKLPLFLVICCFIALSFNNGEVKSKTYYYKSSDSQGYISVEKAEGINGNTILTTRVNANFDNEKLDFNLSTTCDSDKLVNATQIVFDGTIDSNMNPVSFTGKRVKESNSASYWAFEGDYKNEMSIDPEVNQFIDSKHKSMIRMPSRTIPSFNVLAIVPNLEFDRKGTFKFNALDETKLYVKKNQTINYLGQEDTAVDGKNTKLHKFVHQGKGMVPAYYWVNDSKELVKIVLDGKFTFTMSDKEAILFDNVAEGNK